MKTTRIATAALSVLAAGSLSDIRNLLVDHPLTLRLSSDKRRALAAALLKSDSVVGVSLGPGTGPVARGDNDSDRGDLYVKVGHPESFFRHLPSVVLGLGANVERLDGN